MKAVKLKELWTKTCESQPELTRLCTCKSACKHGTLETVQMDEIQLQSMHGCISMVKQKQTVREK